MKKIAFHLQKGGVGKTTLSGNIAYGLTHLLEKKVLLIDGDPQGNLTSWFLKEKPKYELADVLKGSVDVIEALNAISKNLFIIPTFGINGHLRQYAETTLNDEPFIFEELTDIFKKDFDFVIYDMSPGMSRLEKCILLSVDEVITPINAEYFSLDGISIFNTELSKINKSFKKNIKHQKIICNAVNFSFGRHKDFYKEVTQLGYNLFTIGQDSNLAEAQLNNMSIFQYCDLIPTNKKKRTEKNTIPEIIKLAKQL